MASQIQRCDHGPTENEKLPLRDGDIFVKLGLNVDLAGTGDEAKAIVEFRGMDELQYGLEKFGW
jgi:hypothetical protein